MPTDKVPKQNKVFAPLLNIGLECWYEIFNPRQLSALAILTKYVGERSQELVEKYGKFGVYLYIYVLD